MLIFVGITCIIQAFIFPLHMKYITIVCLWIMTSLVSLSGFASFQSSFVEISAQTQVTVHTAIDWFYDIWFAKQSNNFQSSLDQFEKRLSDIRNVVVHYINNNNVSSEIFYALEYLVYRIDLDRANIKNIIQMRADLLAAQLQETLSQNANEPQDIITQEPDSSQNNMEDEEQEDPEDMTQVTEPPITNNAAVPDIQVSSYREWDQNIVGWGFSGPVLQYDLFTQLESAIIEDLELISSNNTFGDAIERVYLYDEWGYEIASVTASQNKVNFNNIDFEVPVGQTSIYIGFDTAPIWRNRSAPLGASMMFTLKSTAYGSISGNDINNTVTSSNKITITPTLITDVQMADHFENRAINNTLSSGENDLAIVVIRTWWGNNTDSTNGSELQTVIDSITVTVDDGTIANNISDTLTLSELNDGGFVSWVDNGDGTVTFFVENLWTKWWIRNNSTKAFVISGTPTLDSNSSNESVRISLDDLDNGSIVYSTSDTNTIAVTSLGLENRFVSGFAVIE